MRDPKLYRPRHEGNDKLNEHRSGMEVSAHKNVLFGKILARQQAGILRRFDRSFLMNGETRRKIGPTEGDALVIVDVQYDFLPGGALAVPKSDEILPVLNDYISIFERR
ncbi:MAG TPA: hypothetical protein VIT23_18700, partial [Terrimicrobiaceae bacterium]